MTGALKTFLSSLDVRDIGAHRWQLLAPFTVNANGGRVTVPTGFVTDFASVPRLPFAFMLFAHIGHRGAVVHDYLYQTAEVPRLDADRIFRELLEAEGVSEWRAAAMFLGVRAFGRKFYAANLTRKKA